MKLETKTVEKTSDREQWHKKINKIDNPLSKLIKEDPSCWHYEWDRMSLRTLHRSDKATVWKCCAQGSACNGACHQACRPEFDPLTPTQWKESADSCKLPSDLHTHTLASSFGVCSVCGDHLFKLEEGWKGIESWRWGEAELTQLPSGPSPAQAPPRAAVWVEHPPALLTSRAAHSVGQLVCLPLS